MSKHVILSNGSEVSLSFAAFELHCPLDKVEETIAKRRPDMKVVDDAQAPVESRDAEPKAKPKGFFGKQDTQEGGEE